MQSYLMVGPISTIFFFSFSYPSLSLLSFFLSGNPILERGSARAATTQGGEVIELAKLRIDVGPTLSPSPLRSLVSLPLSSQVAWIERG